MPKQIKAPKAKARKTFFTVHYYFNGNGFCIIEARTAKEAEQKFRDGDFEESNDNEWGENFSVEKVVKNEDELIARLCDVCHSPEDDDGRCNCTNKDGK